MCFIWRRVGAVFPKLDGAGAENELIRTNSKSGVSLIWEGLNEKVQKKEIILDFFICVLAHVSQNLYLFFFSKLSQITEYLIVDFQCELYVVY